MCSFPYHVHPLTGCYRSHGPRSAVPSSDSGVLRVTGWGVVRTRSYQTYVVSQGHTGKTEDRGVGGERGMTGGWLCEGVCVGVVCAQILCRTPRHCRTGSTGKATDKRVPLGCTFHTGKGAGGRAALSAGEKVKYTPYSSGFASAPLGLTGWGGRDFASGGETVLVYPLYHEIRPRVYTNCNLSTNLSLYTSLKAKFSPFRRVFEC